VRNSGNHESKTEGPGSENKSQIEDQLEDQVDALFKLPLAEFIGARNELVARLKRGGRSDDANLVKAMAKPSVSAWVVNQLYWYHREEFDELLAAGGRVRQAQPSRTSAHAADMRESLEARRESLEARREALRRLTESATAMLGDAGHNPTPDTLHRITTTLEAVSAYASLSDGPTPGRLSRDLDPPGFESLASLMAGALTTKAGAELAPATPLQDAPSSITQTDIAVTQTASSRTEGDQGPSPVGDVAKTRELEEARQAGIAAARASLEDAERQLTDAMARANQLEAAREKADAEAHQAEKELRELEERLKKASADSLEAAERSQSIAAETKEAAQVLEEAKRSVEIASKELESLLRQSAAG